MVIFSTDITGNSQEKLVLKPLCLNCRVKVFSIVTRNYISKVNYYSFLSTRLIMMALSATRVNKAKSVAS